MHENLKLHWAKVSKKYGHYKKDVRHLDYIDVYRVAELYGITHPADLHILKKFLAMGKRKVKSEITDAYEIADAMLRKAEMLEEDQRRNTLINKIKFLFRNIKKRLALYFWND